MLPKYNDIVDLIKKGSTIEAQEKILELRQAALDLQEENISLKETLKALEKLLATKGAIIYEAPYYWLVEADKRDGPFCQRCQDADSKLMRLQRWDTGHWVCRGCKAEFFNS